MVISYTQMKFLPIVPKTTFSFKGHISLASRAQKILKVSSLAAKVLQLYFILNLVFCQPGFRIKLDGVGPVDKRPSTNKLHHFVLKKKHVTCDM